MPMQRELYPDNWEAISLSRRVAAHWRCEYCGAKHGMPHPETGSMVVLTVAHLDHDPANCALGNLRALCQRCHLRYDALHHARNAKRTRRQRQVDAGQLEMIAE